MEPENNTPEESPAQPKHPFIQTYRGDLAKAMDTTDAATVQDLMRDAREREQIQVQQTLRLKQRGWYVLASGMLILFALGAIGYGVYYFKHLTVPVTKEYSVGIFPTTQNIAIGTTDIRSTIESFLNDATLSPNKPTLLQLVSSERSSEPIAPNDFFRFIESGASEPFVHAIALARLGVMNTDSGTVPFVIMSVKDADTAAKEFLIAEPKMLQMFYHALDIDISTHNTEIGKSFEGGYLYNIPVRTLFTTSAEASKREILFLYGSVTPDIVVVTTSPEVLKAIYEAVIRQQ